MARHQGGSRVVTSHAAAAVSTTTTTWHHAYAGPGGDRALAKATRHSSLTPAPTWHSRGATIASTGPWRVIRCSPRTRSPLVPRSSPALRCSPSLSPPTHRRVVGGRGHALAKDRFSQGTPTRHGVDRRSGETGSIPALNITDSATAPDADGRGGGTSDSRTAHSQIKRRPVAEHQWGGGDKPDSRTVHSQIRAASRLQSTSDRGDKLPRSPIATALTNPRHTRGPPRGETTSALANLPRHSPLRRRPITSTLASSPRRQHGPPHSTVATEFANRHITHHTVGV